MFAKFKKMPGSKKAATNQRTCSAGHINVAMPNIRNVEFYWRPISGEATHGIFYLIAIEVICFTVSNNQCRILMTDMLKETKKPLQH